MTNNDILRSIRYTFDFSDDKMISLFANAGLEVSRAEVCDWLKREDDPEVVNIQDRHLSVFLNGFIIDRRGKKDVETPLAEKKLNNNIIFRKLKIALNYKDEDILNVLSKVNFNLGKHELSAFFRNPTQNQYRECKDQVLRNFLKGLQVVFKNNPDS